MPRQFLIAIAAALAVPIPHHGRVFPWKQMQRWILFQLPLWLLMRVACFVRTTVVRPLWGRWANPPAVEFTQCAPKSAVHACPATKNVSSRVVPGDFRFKAAL